MSIVTVICVALPSVEGGRLRARRPFVRMGGVSRDEEKLLARLDEAFAGQRAALSAAQLAVARAWQRTDRHYELIQAVARGNVDTDRITHGMLVAALTFQQALDSATRSASLPFDLTVYRGVRSLRRTFGTDSPEDIPSKVGIMLGYTATSIFERVARDEFAAPAGALMRIEVPRGTPALWVAGIGSPRLRRQGELPLSDRLRVVVSRRWTEYRPCVLAMEVISQ